jgi:hypothetical protein
MNYYVTKMLGHGFIFKKKNNENINVDSRNQGSEREINRLLKSAPSDFH